MMIWFRRWKERSPSVTTQSEYFSKAGGTNDSFPFSLYRDVLLRPIDPGGASTWSQALLSGASRGGVAQMILDSQESLTGEVQGLYQEFLRRPAGSSFFRYPQWWTVQS